MLLKNSKPKQPTIFGHLKQPTIFGPTVLAHFALLLLPTTSKPTKNKLPLEASSVTVVGHSFSPRAIDVQTSTGLQVNLSCTFTGAFQCVFTVGTKGQRCANQVVKGSWRGDDTMSAGVKGQLCTVAAVVQAIHIAWGARKGNKKRAVAGIHICHMS